MNLINNNQSVINLKKTLKYYKNKPTEQIDEIRELETLLLPYPQFTSSIMINTKGIINLGFTNKQISLKKSYSQQYSRSKIINLNSKIRENRSRKNTMPKQLQNASLQLIAIKKTKRQIHTQKQSRKIFQHNREKVVHKDNMNKNKNKNNNENKELKHQLSPIAQFKVKLKIKKLENNTNMLQNIIKKKVQGLNHEQKLNFIYRLAKKYP